MCQNHWACTLDPVSHNYWAHTPISRAPQQEKPPQWEDHTPQQRVAPLAATGEKIPHTTTKTQCIQKQINKFVLNAGTYQKKIFYIQTQRSSHRLVQDGRVEGCALTPSCESTGITTNCWTIIDRKTLELTKKDTPHPKTKEEPQWGGRRGAITIKSNPVTAGWVTHKLENNYTTEVHPLEWRLWAPRQASQPGGSDNGRKNS